MTTDPIAPIDLSNLPAPQYVSRDGTVVLYRGDCLALLPQLPKGCVDAVVTDPPYGVHLADWDNRVPHELCKTFHELTTGPIVWFGAAPQHRNDLLAFDPPPQRVCVWNPAFTLSKTAANGFFYRWHPVYCWQLPKTHNGPSDDVWRHMIGMHHEWDHPATKPIDLITDCVRIAPAGGCCLDPFLGSGTTAVACVRTGRRCIGIELEPRYFDIAVRRVEQAIEQRDGGGRSETAARPVPEVSRRPPHFVLLLCD